MKAMSVKEAAKQLGTGERRLFALMRRHGWLCMANKQLRNYPSSLAMAKGYLLKRQTQYNIGPVRNWHFTCEVTHRGIVALADLVANDEMETRNPVVLTERPGLQSEPGHQQRRGSIHGMGPKAQRANTTRKAG